MKLNNIYYTSIPENIELEYPITTKSIPDDIIGEIISFLPQKEVNSCSLVNKQWNYLSNFHGNWEQFYKQSFPNTGLQVTKNEWRQHYINESNSKKDMAPQLIREKIDEVFPERNKFVVVSASIIVIINLALLLYVAVDQFNCVFTGLNMNFNATLTNSTNVIRNCLDEKLGDTEQKIFSSMVVLIASIFFFTLCITCVRKNHTATRSYEQLGRLSKEYVKDKCCRSCNIL